MAVVKASASLAPVVSALYGNTGDVRLEITNWNEIMKVLVKLDKDYVKALRKDFRQIAKPVQAEVKKAIPGKGSPPLSGMRQVHFGRLAWGSTWGSGAKPSKSVLIQTPNTRARKYKNKDISIARLQVQSPGTVLTDMAYSKGGVRGRKGMTPSYDYMYTIGGQKVPGKRKHRVVPGVFGRGLDSARKTLQNRASRFIWPAALKALPAAQKQMDQAITAVNIRVNALLRSK